MLDREAMRLYKRGQRRQWREQGLCVICGAAVGRAGRKTCDRCSERAAAWAKRKREGCA